MAVYRLGFVMEQTLGHVTHYCNLRQWVSRDAAVLPTWMPVETGVRDLWERLPLNWTMRASLRARAQVRAALRSGPLDGLFYHTQVTALMAHSSAGGRPYVVSLDATPIGLDAMGAAYGHRPSRLRAVEAAKNAWMRRVFTSATRLTTWNEWAKRSLVEDYGIEADKVVVISPGIDLTHWQFPRALRPSARLPRVLFVGGDFARKGGDILLEVFRDRFQGQCELDIVTRDEVDVSGLAGARVHRGLTANSPELLRLYQEADVFALPTRAECHPIAAIESLAAGLPVISTTIGAIPEVVRNGETGLLVPPGDPAAFGDALSQFVRDASLVLEMGRRAQKDAAERFDAEKNYRRLVEMLKECVDVRL